MAFYHAGLCACVLKKEELHQSELVSLAEEEVFGHDLLMCITFLFLASQFMELKLHVELHGINGL